MPLFCARSVLITCDVHPQSHRKKALEGLPNVHSLGFGYPDSNSSPRFSLGSLILKKDNNKSTDLTLAAASAHNALRALEASGKRYRPAALQRIIRLIAIATPQLAEKLTSKVRSSPSPELPGSPLRGHTDEVYAVAFLPDGRHLVSGSRDKMLRIWDIETGKTVIGPLVGHTRPVCCVAVHGSRIASCSYDGTFSIWDADSGKLVLGPITAHQGKAVYCIAYSRDGTRIATAGADNCAAIWDANTGVQLREMVGHTSYVMCVAFSEDGTRLVSGSCDATVRIWDVASGECIGEPLTGHTNWVTAACFSRDDKRIFSLSDDCTIRIWDAETRELIVEPLQMGSWVVCMALSPDGKRLASGSVGGKIALRDVQTGAAIPTPFRDHEAGVYSVAFSPDGCMIASASRDKTIALWDATDEDVEQDND
ncbi:WD40 repeat-like protein [Exidia glandulosa HHB12029]|uniref:WD40 repeat-like protein n=1 Tax=Exidia glandulosa HHB12029 TaxID=1314781 RepID=A0A165I6W0_EXIGL|nr:WD40 repeat-like protein [Exidia glandulosa HHB12029]